MSLSRLIMYFCLLVVFGCICFGKWAPASADQDALSASNSAGGLYNADTVQMQEAWFNAMRLRAASRRWRAEHLH